MYFEGKTVAWCAGRYSPMPVIVIAGAAVALAAGILCIVLLVTRGSAVSGILGAILIIGSLIAGWRGIELRKTEYTMTMTEFILSRWKGKTVIRFSDINRVDVTDECPRGAVDFSVGKTTALVYLMDGTCYAISCSDDGFVNGIRERSRPTDTHRDWRKSEARAF